MGSYIVPFGILKQALVFCWAGIVFLGGLGQAQIDSVGFDCSGLGTTRLARLGSGSDSVSVSAWLHSARFALGLAVGVGTAHPGSNTMHNKKGSSPKSLCEIVRLFLRWVDLVVSVATM